MNRSKELIEKIAEHALKISKKYPILDHIGFKTIYEYGPNGDENYNEARLSALQIYSLYQELRWEDPTLKEADNVASVLREVYNYKQKISKSGGAYVKESDCESWRGRVSCR